MEEKIVVLTFRNLTAYCGSFIPGLTFSPISLMFLVMVIFVLIGKTSLFIYSNNKSSSEFIYMSLFPTPSVSNKLIIAF